jgi:hypothetical protein
LRQRRLGNEERPGDLVRLETAERAQRQRDARLERERGVAAGEDQAQPLVRDRRFVHVLVVLQVCFEPGEQLRLALQVLLTTDPVDRPVPRDGHEPPGRVRRGAVARPALQRGGDRVLEGVRGGVAVAEVADQGGAPAPVLLAKELLERPYAETSACRITIGRTSIVP